MSQKQLSPAEYEAELERHIRALNEYVGAMAVDDEVNLDVMSDSFAVVLSHYLGQVHPDRLINIINRFDELFDDGLNEYLVPEGAVIQ